MPKSDILVIFCILFTFYWKLWEQLELNITNRRHTFKAFCKCQDEWNIWQDKEDESTTMISIWEWEYHETPWELTVLGENWLNIRLKNLSQKVEEK